MSTKHSKWDRDLEVAYWFSYPHMKRPSSKGFPKSEAGEKGKSGGAAGALRAINSGWATKVQLTNRKTGRVVWTAVRQKVPGISNVYMAVLVPGDNEFAVKKGK